MREYAKPGATVERLMREYVRRNATVIDVGAGQGKYTVLLAELVGSAGRVIAFEPVREALAVVAQRTSRYPQVTMQPLALADTGGTRAFYVDMRPEQEHTASSLFKLDGLEGFREERRIECTTLDAFCARERIAPTFLKVVAEGAEPLVFAGAKRVLREHRPVVVYELWETWWERGHAQLWDDLSKTHRVFRMTTEDGVSRVVALPLG